MKIYLTKQNRKTIDFVLLESDDNLVRKSSGKIGKSGISNSTLNAGSSDKAITEINKQVDDYQTKGYVLTNLPPNLADRDTVFDKAKWHINDKFPSELDHYQSYVHTGLYIAWLIDNDFLEPDFKVDHVVSIQKHQDRTVSPTEFYESELDGVFDAEGLTQEAIKFTSDYFNFDKGEYLTDYLSTLDPSDKMPSLFHIADTWENYDCLKPILDSRFEDWKKINANTSR